MGASVRGRALEVAVCRTDAFGRAGEDVADLVQRGDAGLDGGVGDGVLGADPGAAAAGTTAGQPGRGSHQSQSHGHRNLRKSVDVSAGSYA